jgi:hypothetical protein
VVVGCGGPGLCFVYTSTKGTFLLAPSVLSFVLRTNCYSWCVGGLAIVCSRFRSRILMLWRWINTDLIVLNSYGS